jgi:methionyl-tRNA formyltransferase
MPLRLLFFGTPGFAVPSLTALLESSHQVAAVISQPDRPRGRGQKIQPEAVKRCAVEHHLPVIQPDRLTDGSLLADLRTFRPDLAVVAAYGRLLPQALLEFPRLGFINVHASLLPRWRGAAPVHRAILAGDEQTGVTIMRIVLALDAGAMLAREATPIDPNETSETLEARLAIIGARLLTNTIDRLAAGQIEETPQDESLATYAPRLQRSDSLIDWARPAREIHNRIRGLHPWPLASARLNAQRLVLRRSVSTDLDSDGRGPGTIVSVTPEGLDVATSRGTIRIIEVQPEGRRAMTVRDFLNGTRVAVGDTFQ